MEILLYDGIIWYLPQRTKANVDILIDTLAFDEMDIVIVVDGPEGTGKSFLARGLCRYIATRLRETYPNTTFGPDDIEFTVKDYIDNSVRVGSPKDNNNAVKINLLDEGRHAIGRRNATSLSNKVFTNYLSECRALTQVHIILAPAFHDLDKNLVLWRRNCIFHTIKKYKKKGGSYRLQRGEYKLFTNTQHIAGVYLRSNAFYSYPQKCEDHNSWSSVEVFNAKDLQAYNDKKYKFTLQKYADNSEQNKLDKDTKVTTDLVPSHVAAKALNLNSSTVLKWITAGKLTGSKVGNQWFISKNQLDKKFGVKLI